ncbi:Calx-beta domain-containing protein [Flavobacteriaceae bacterium S356]|uniref:Calx-beta domain-containing protein n=1 Tax=Asprobacillus argus TaxID=3076534 RepID=A0ABU3LB04_9FLAO|nr:Calx-beta domain-containing protein [Flavobacteriaceae bacterium S356]
MYQKIILFICAFFMLNIVTAQFLTYNDGTYDIAGYTSGTSVALHVGLQEGSPTAMLFNNDGTILYVMGHNGDDINAYPLPTPYDISSYTSGASVALNVGAQESLPNSMLFNDDGTILYVMGSSGDDINAYPLPTSYDIASYTSGTSVALSVGAQESIPFSMLFNNDGTILYVMGIEGDDINAYPLPTPYDISSYTSGTSVALDVGAQESLPYSMLFNNDGTILYVMGADGDNINAYPLPTPYDIASYTSGTSVVLNVGAQDDIPVDMLFNDDGTILYVMGFNGENIHAYPLPGLIYSEAPANDGTIDNSNPLTIDLTGDTFVDLGSGALTSAQVTVGNVPVGLTAVMTITNPTQLTLTFTGTATAHDHINDVSNLTFAFTDLAFAGGNASVVTKSGSSAPYQSVAGMDFRDTPVITIADVSSNEDNGNITITATLDNAVAGGFTVDVSTADGTATIADNDYTAISNQILTFAGTAGEIQTFTLTPTSDAKTEDDETIIISMSNLSISNTSVDITDTATITLTNDDVSFLSYNDGLYDIAGYTSGTSSVLNVGSQESSPFSMLFNNNGTTLYVIGTNSDKIHAYPLPIPYDVSSYAGGTSEALDVSQQEMSPQDMLFNDDGTTLYVLGDVGNDITAYPLDTAYDISSYTSGTSVALDVSAQETSLRSMLFNDDGTILYVMGSSGDDINAYPLPTPYEISSYSTGTSVALNVDAQDSNPIAMLFNDDGTILYVMGQAGNDINAYPLDTPYDISSYTSGTSIVLNVGAQDAAPSAILFNDDGTILYMIGYINNEIHAYPLPPFMYSEAPANDGTIDNSNPLTIDLTGDTFVDLGSGTLTGAQVTVGNVPVGLTAVMTITSPTQLTLTFTGTATAHDNINDVSNLTFAFTDLAFAGGNASVVAKSGSSAPYQSVAGMDFRDTPVITIADVSSNEDNGNITITATLDNDVAGGFIVEVSTADGTATIADNDYTAISNQILTFAGTAGEIQTFTLTPTSDAKTEDDETIIISMSNVSNTSVDITDTATITLTNDDISYLTYKDGAYDIAGYTSGTYTALNVSIQESSPLSMLFNNDGTILYVLGNDGDKINAYPLDIAYDISSYTSGTSVTLDVSAQDTNPKDMLFNDDGTILYVLGDDGDDINAYPLPTPYDISSYTSGTSEILDIVSASVLSLMLFNDDGTTLYILQGHSLYAYELPIPYDISSYTSGALSVLNVFAQDIIPKDMLFNSNGTILYLLGDSHNDITAYVLSIPYDISSHTSGTSIALDVGTQENTPTTMLFNHNGTNLYVMGESGDIHTYPLPTLIYSEAPANDGTIDNSNPLTIDLTGDTFVDLGSGTLTGAQVTVGNVPAGLTAVMTITSPTELTLTFTGTATAHDNINDVSNLTFAFTDLAFAGGNASVVTKSGSSTPYQSVAGMDFEDNFHPAITQIYENTGGKVIELTNIGTVTTIPENTLHLCLFTNASGDQTGVTPSAVYTIPFSLAPATTILVESSGLSGVTIINSPTREVNAAITNFEGGDDIIIISNTSDGTAWQNRFDVAENFYDTTSYVRSDEVIFPNTIYTASEWIAFVDDTLDPYRAQTSGGPERHPHAPLISEVSGSTANKNQGLGYHKTGVTSRTGSAWSNGEPDRSRRVSIDEDYHHTGSNFTARTLTVNNNSKFSITNDLLLVSEQINLTATNDEIRLIDGSQLITTHASISQTTGSGKLYVDQDSDVSSLYRYNYFGSPVNSIGSNTYSVADILKDGTNPTSELSTPLNINFIGGFDGNAATSPISLAEYWIYTFGASASWDQVFSNGTIPQTDGFIFKGPGQAQNYTFAGTPKDGTLQTNVAANTSYLLGNPYASAIRSQKFIEDNLSSITGTLYFWEQKESVNGEVDQNGHNHNGYVGGYAIRNIAMGIAANNVANEDSSTGAAGLGQGVYKEPAPYIAIGQGFFVGGSITGGTIEFNNSQREFIQEGTQSVFFRNSNSYNNLAALKIGMDYLKEDEELELHRQIGISFIDGNTFGYEKGYDSPALDLGTTDIYWDLGDDTPYFIAGVGAIEDNMEVPLTILMGYSGEIHLSLDEWDHIDREVYIFDQLEGTYYHISQSKATLTLEVGEYKDRFTLLLSAEVLHTSMPDLTNSLLFIFSDTDQQEIVVQNYNGVTLENVRLYDILGREIRQWDEDLKVGPELRLKLRKKLEGVYIIKIKTNKGVISKKLFLKY